jgi:hypothetical protein
MSTMSTANTTQVYRVYIRTSPEAVWDAITKPEWTERYGYGGVADYDLRPGGRAIKRPGAAMKAYPGVREVIIAVATPFRRRDGSYRFENAFRYVLSSPSRTPTPTRS